MKQIQFTLYNFDELSPEIQKIIIDRERWNVMESCMDGYASDYRNSLEKFEKLFDISCVNWEVSYCGYHHYFRVERNYAFEWDHNGWDGIELETLSGHLLVRYLHQNILPLILKGKYYGKLLGVPPNWKHISRYSKVMFECNCPLTGCCYDHDLLEPLLEYLRKPDLSVTFRDLVDCCLQSFFRAWHNEYEYWADDENAIRDELHNNQYEDRLYHPNGDVYSGPLENAA